MPCVPHTWPTSDAAPSFAWLPDSHRPCRGFGGCARPRASMNLASHRLKNRDQRRRQIPMRWTNSTHVTHDRTGGVTAVTFNGALYPWSPAAATAVLSRSGFSHWNRALDLAQLV